MELILARLSNDDNLEEITVIDDFISYNNVLSLQPTLEANDWELQIDFEVFEKYKIALEDWIYIPESEFGGIVKNIENKNNIIYLSGPNFRGYLANHIIVPPYQSEGGGRFLDYIRWSGDANFLVWEYFQRDDSQVSSTNLRSDPYVVGTTEPTGVNLTTQFRFINYLRGMTNLLKDNGLRLEAKHLYIQNDNSIGIRYPDYHGDGNSFVFKIEAVEITDYTEDETFSNDFDITINSGIRTQNEAEFLFALGSGEMEDRTIVVLKNGEVVNYATHESQGALWSARIYDYPNAESREELIKDAKKHYLENYLRDEFIELDLNNVDIEFFLGDKISARDEVTGLHTEAEITEKELMINENGTKKTYKVGGI